jgi:Flp pilus assembly protein TadG
MNTTITTEQSLSDKLYEAIHTQRRVTNAYEVAALAVEQGRASDSDLAKAIKDAQAADKRVSDLRAAFTAFEQAEAAHRRGTARETAR